MLNIMLCIAWAPILLHYARSIFVRMPFVGEENVDKAIVISVVLSVLFALPALINRFSLIDYLFYILNVFYLLSCYVFFPENEIYLNEEVPICVFCVFTYYFVGRESFQYACISFYYKYLCRPILLFHLFASE